MRIAIPHWQGRIAPVFDAASHLALVDVENGRAIRREEVRLLTRGSDARAAELKRYGVSLLICGAISAPLQLKIAASGIQVISFLCGAMDDVLSAYLDGTICSRGFVMPGCQRWRGHSGEDVLPIGRRKNCGCFSKLGTRGGPMSKLRADEAAATMRIDRFSICPKCGEEIQQKLGRKRSLSLCPKCCESIEAS